MSFFNKYHSDNADKIGLCVGIDPTPEILKNWGLDDSSESLLAYGKTVLEAADGLVRIVKPQVAYFERLGPAGYSALAAIIAEARERGLLVIADAKRGDIGSTVDAYTHPWMSKLLGIGCQNIRQANVRTSCASQSWNIKVICINLHPAKHHDDSSASLEQSHDSASAERTARYSCVRRNHHDRISNYPVFIAGRSSLLHRHLARR